MKCKFILSTAVALLLGCTISNAAPSPKDVAKELKSLEAMVAKAKKSGADVQREECAIWMAKEFLMYAAWDAKNVEMNEYQYKTWGPYKERAAELAEALPDFEREEVLKIIECAKEELGGVLEGRYTRRSVPQIDWTNITPEGRQFVSNGRPVFANSYFTKPEHQANEYLSYIKGSSLALNAIRGEDGGISYMGTQRFVEADDSYSGYVLLWHGVAPQWISAQESDVAVGKRLFTHYDIDNPLIRTAWDLTFKACAPLIKERRQAQQGYILANEPHWYTRAKAWATGEVSEYTKANFRDWLACQHDSIETMNSLWGTNFESFQDVDIVIPMPQEELTTPKGYDWQRFNMFRVTDWFTFLDGSLKSYDPDARTHIKIIPHMFNEGAHDHGLDMEALYSLTDIVGNDAKIIKKNPYKKVAAYWEKHYAFDWFELAMSYDFFHSVNPNGPNVNSESHFLSASTYRDIYMTKEFTRTAYWYATLHGMNLSYSWFWARESDGSIRKDLRASKKQFDNAMNSAYVASVVQQPRVANEVTKTYMDINAYGLEMAQLQSQRRPIRLFYSECAVLNKPSTMDSNHHLYERLYFEGTPLGYATKGIIERESNDNWDVVLVYDMESVLESEIEALQSYLDRGGVVVIDEKSLKLDQYKRPHTKSLEASNGELITVSTLDEYFEVAFAKAAPESLTELTLEESNAIGANGCMWRELKLDDGSYLVTICNLGKSSATLTLGTKSGSPISQICEELLGVNMANGFTLPSESTLLLNVKVK